MLHKPFVIFILLHLIFNFNIQKVNSNRFNSLKDESLKKHKEDVTSIKNKLQLFKKCSTLINEFKNNKSKNKLELKAIALIIENTIKKSFNEKSIIDLNITLSLLDKLDKELIRKRIYYQIPKGRAFNW
jgi:hypothetical protein